MRTLWLLACAALLQACALPRTLPAASALDAGGSEVVVIGKVELVPPIDPRHEQRTHWNVVGEKRILDRVIVATGAEHRPLNTGKLDPAEFQAAVEAEWGVPFMVRAPRQRTYLNGAVATLDVVEQERLWFPGGWYFDVPPGTSAVYIGTLRFHRNDFNTITRVEVLDERRDVAAVLKAGHAGDVRPSLLKRVR